MTELASVLEQERLLVLPRFNELVAFDLVKIAMDIAAERELAVVVDVRTFDRQLAFLSRPGTTAANGEWVRRKSNTVRRFLRSSYRIVLERGGEGLFPPEADASGSDYVKAGGSFPITVDGAGIVGTITISGLSGRADHELAVRTLATFVGRDPASVALPPE